MTSNIREITDYSEFRRLVNKSKDNYVLVYAYPTNEKDVEYLNRLRRVVRKQGKRKTQVYTFGLCKYPTMCQTRPSTNLYLNGHKLFQFYGHVSQAILEEAFKRYCC